MSHEGRPAVLSSEERARLALINRLLLNVTTPGLAQRCLAAGYTNREHARGQALYQTASGADRPFSHAIAGVELAQLGLGTPSGNERYRAVDEFENTWFPQLEKLFVRCLSDAERPGIRDAFFADLAQQPLGPGVIASVALFLQRLDALQVDPSPGVTEVFEILEERGLTARVRADMVKRLEGYGTLSTATAPTTVSLEELLAADAAQREAYVKLSAWYADVAGNLRGRLGYHHRVILGISEVKGGKGHGGDEPASGDPGDPPSGSK